MTRKTTGPRGYPTEITHSSDRVLLRVPLGSGDELIGWLSAEYTRSDPLVVSVSVSAPSRAVVLERTLLRSDLRRGHERPVRYANVVVEPAGVRGFTSVQFEERHVIVTALIPTEVFARFLRATDDVVSPGEAETLAVSSQLADLLEDRSV
ncbi:MAG: SsgA family sporulation/cell division regulator [Actinomycetota bacterium]